MADELRDLRDWLPYSPRAKVEITYVEAYVEEAVSYQPDRPRSTRLVQAVMEGTARPNERRHFAAGEGIWWIRGHHDETDRDGQALLAAWALDRSAA